MSNNVIRQKIPKRTDGGFQLPNGYDGENSVSSDLFIPPCKLEDIDGAVFRLFEEDLKYTARKISTKDEIINLKKPEVILASGERAGLIKRMKPIRDPRTGALILPLIAIRQTSIDQEYSDIASRGINPGTGEIVVKTKLSVDDVNHQRILNKIGLANLTNQFPKMDGTEGYAVNSKDQATKQGILLDPRLNNNIYEIISVPAPQFITVKYEVTFWTLDLRHMSYMIETLLAAQLPQGKFFKLHSTAGYWFIGFLSESITADDNFDDYTEEKKLVKRKFEFEVKGYLLAPNGPNNMVPVKRQYSAPTLLLDVREGIVESKKKIDKVKIQEQEDKFILSDLEEDPELAQEPSVEDKFLLQQKRYNPRTQQYEEVFVKRVADSNGETVYTASDTETLMEFFYGKK